MSRCELQPTAAKEVMPANLNYSRTAAKEVRIAGRSKYSVNSSISFIVKTMRIIYHIVN